MPLQLVDAWKQVQLVGSHWRLPGEPAFSESHAYDLLLYDMQRYTREEVGGRSFLIAGHRGAGKTTTVVQAVRHLRNEIFKDSESSAKMPVGRRSKVQRPLLIKLVGQRLLEPPPKLPKAEEGDADGAATEEGGAGEGAGEATEAPAKAGGSEAASALVHMTIGLYRALAAEYAEAFRNHAMLADGKLIDDDALLADRLELAAQFELDLDSAPTPANLRPYWNLIGRLKDGILWPAECDEAFRANRIYGRGLREVVAIATASQVFQVCSGAVTYKEVEKKTDDTRNVSTYGLDTKQLISRLGAIGAGTLAGALVGANEGTLPGIGTGLLAWILAGATLSWSGTRTRTRDRTLDYTFIRDSSLQTLDRDLPLVIERIRDAGLSPVFVIDELDKLEGRQEATIASLINRLKHLVSDYGFFCFLTGRDYFDLVARRVVEEIYPTEHTYFSERLLVINRPDDLFAYLLSLVGVPPPHKAVFPLPAAVFALSMMFWAKLNFSDVNREVSTVSGKGGALTCTDEELKAIGRYRLAATIQIAINRILARPETSERMKDDPSFAQLALDALYYIPRCWEGSIDAALDTGPEALAEHLARRMAPARKKAAPADPEPGEDPADPQDGGVAPESPLPSISGPDLRELSAMVTLLAGYLSDFSTLKKELEDEANAVEKTNLVDAGNLRVLAQIVLTERKGLIAAAEAAP